MPENPTQNGEARGFEIGLRVIPGSFPFQKMAMVNDLQERANELPVHDVIAAIAGDSKAKSAMNAELSDPDPKEFDLIPPDNEFLVLGADSSQQRAIAAVMTDQSRVIHGPPGTVIRVQYNDRSAHRLKRVVQIDDVDSVGGEVAR
jgi:hypothetical protein